MNIADLGLGNSLTNAISDAFGKNRSDLARSYVASVFWMLICIAILLGGVFTIASHYLDWVKLLNVTSSLAKAEVAPAIAVAISIFLLNLPLTIVGNILAGHQETALANYWAAAGNVASLFALIVAVHFQGGLVWLVIALSGSLWMVSAISALWLFVRHKPWLVPGIFSITRTSLKKLSNIGGMFLVVQVAALLVLQTDNLIIAHYLGAGAVTPYSVTWRLFSCTTMLQMILVQSLWPAYAEAFSRGDGDWIKRTLRMNLRVSFLTTAALVAPLVFFGNFIIEHWAGSAAVPPFAVIECMAVWSLINAVLAPAICLLNGTGHVQGQMVYGILTALTNIILSIILVQRMGIAGVILSTVIAYLVCGVIPVLVETALVCKKLPKTS
jgi:O-antigen/teichoic acid export membrane protein